MVRERRNYVRHLRYAHPLIKRMRTECVPGSLFLFRVKEPGYEARLRIRPLLQFIPSALKMMG